MLNYDCTFERGSGGAVGFAAAVEAAAAVGGGGADVDFGLTDINTAV